MKIAIIDLGTNSVRLFVYKRGKKKKFLRVRKKKVMVRLGDGLFETGELSEEAIERTVAAFMDFKTILAEEKPDLLRAVGTSALRECSNPERLVNKVAKKTGIAIEVIPGEEEGRLIAVGVQASLTLPEEACVLVDIGGGSTEISILENNEIVFLASLNLGAGRNQQTFLRTVPPIRGVKGKGMKALREHVTATLHKNIPKRFTKSIPTLIGTSGSIRAMARIETSSGGSASTLTTSEVRELVSKLKHKDHAEILATFPKLEEKRVDLILAATIILDEINRFFQVEEMRITSCSLKDGILANVQSRYHL